VKLETSPGGLDRFLTLQAWTPAAEGKPELFPVAAKSDHLLFTGAKAGDIVLAENHAAPVSQRGDQPPRKSFLYLRWQPVTATAAAPGLTLDLVREAGSLRVYFRGQPLAGAEVVLHGPGREGRNLHHGRRRPRRRGNASVRPRDFYRRPPRAADWLPPRPALRGRLPLHHPLLATALIA
jgi:hypothetical protein